MSEEVAHVEQCSGQDEQDDGRASDDGEEGRTDEGERSADKQESFPKPVECVAGRQGQKQPRDGKSCRDDSQNRRRSTGSSTAYGSVGCIAKVMI